MRALFVSCFLVALVLAGAAVGVPAPLQVTTKSGVLEGDVVDGSRHFLGVPFAEPPIGDLRWRRPVPVQPWTGVLSAKEFGADCPQSQNGLDWGSSMNESCLYLNVYTPADVPPAPLPVVVFFYGGSWSYGGASFPIYDGDMIEQALQNDVIVVTTNYRLSVLGWIGDAILAKEDPLGSVANYGLQDQRMALQWVHDNIAAFGGNPSAVTIWGESAGAGSVSTHLTAPASWPLFHAGIMDSGPPANWTARSLEMAEAHWSRVATAVGCTGSDQVTCMRNTPWKVLLKHECNLPGSLVSFTPVVDGVELLAEPPVLVRNGSFHKVPVMMGLNANAGTLFTPLKHDSTTQDLVAWLGSEFGADVADKVLAAYPEDRYPTPWWRSSDIFTDAAMLCPVRRDARWMSAAGVPVYTYYFTHIIALIGLDEYLGVFHGSELAFTWGFTELLVQANEVQLSKYMMRYWMNMVMSGSPNGATFNSSVLPLEWPQYSTSTDLTFNLNVFPTVNTGLRAAQCDMWDAVFAAQHPQ